MFKVIVIENRAGIKFYDYCDSLDGKIENIQKNIIEDVLNKSGFSPNLKGYSYLVQAIVLCCNEPELLVCKTKVLYPRLSRLNNVSAESIEKSICASIKSAWIRCRGNNFYCRVGCKYIIDNKRPTCSEIINILTEFINKKGVN